MKITEKELEFLRESNAIEEVHDALSLEQAIYAWDYLKQQDELTPDIVRKTHKILMLYQDLMPNEKGYFRKAVVYIGGKEALDWHDIEAVMKLWCKQVSTPKQAHIDYEAIHPFIDGNGRTGRMFMNWQYLKQARPIKIIHTGEEQYSYYKWFR